VRGSYTAEYNADTVIKVENGIATTTSKSRFGRAGSTLDINPVLSRMKKFSEGGERTLNILPVHSQTAFIAGSSLNNANAVQ
jgi:hypothetical protein